jgi:drug/metabolite transporter (DMT)-like permease
MYLTSSIEAAATADAFTSSPLTRAAPLHLYTTGILGPNGDGNSQLQRWSSLIGIVTAIVGNILISFALNIQRYAHIRLHKERQERSRRSTKSSKNGYGTTAANGNGASLTPRLEEGNGDETDPLARSFDSSDSQATICLDDDHFTKTTYLKSPYWWAGILLMTIGETGNFLAYGFAPASIVSPLGVVALISNCVIAPFMLKERFRWRDFAGVVVAVGGAVTVVLSAKQKEKKLGPHEVIGAITTMEFEIYMGVTFALIAILIWASPKYGNKTILIDLGLVGLFGGYTALSTKGVASMLSSTLWKAFASPITYALVAVLIGTAIMQVRYVNKALQRFDSTQVIPVQFVMFTLSVIIGSGILYRDFEKTTVERMVKFVGGCLLTFFGVFLITSGRAAHRDEEDEESDEENEGRIRLGAQQHDAEGQFYGNNYKFGDTQHIPRAIHHGVDGSEDVNDTYEERSRRSSHVSFASTPPKPEIHRIHSDSAITPTVQITPSDDPSTSFAESSSSLTSNPWKTSVDERLAAQRHPGLPTMASAPVLPCSVQTAPQRPDPSRPEAPRAASQALPHTHPNDQNHDGPPQADPQRPVTPVSAARHSLSRMMPGPLVSPLSSSLAAVVADSLLRGVDHPLRRRSMKRPRLLLRRSKSRSERCGSEDAVGEDEDAALLVGTTTSQSRSLGSKGGEEALKRSRARSLSNTLGEFWRGKRPRRDEADGNGEDENGPSVPSS